MLATAGSAHDAGRPPRVPGRSLGVPPASRRRRHATVVVSTTVVAALSLSACSLHISKNGVSGNILGHSFAGSRGALPTGFPSNVPVPDSSRVLGGAGTQNRWDAAFAVTGSVATGSTAYESKFRSAGYTVTNIQSGVTSVTATTSAGATSSTVTLSGSSFTATGSGWTVEVLSGSTTSPTGGTLRTGEYAVNITVVPVGSVPTSAP